MDDENLLIICRACGRKVLMHNMRPDDDGEHMICNDCWKRKQGAKGASSSNVFGKKDVENTPYQPQKSTMKAQKSEKLIKYVCTSCKYKFSRKASQQVEKCPYCSKESVVLDSAMGADKLIKDSQDKRFEW
jgi:protein-arginine kinase activator protein McsA